MSSRATFTSFAAVDPLFHGPSDAASAVDSTLQTRTQAQAQAQAQSQAQSQALSPSPSLSAFTASVPPLMYFLDTALGPVPLTRVRRAVVRAADKLLVEQVVLRSRFSSAGGRQLSADVGLVESVIGCAAGAGGPLMHRAREAAVLLSLPAHDDDDGDTNNSNNDDGDDDEPATNVFLVERELFASNEQAADVLESLSLDTLTESEARNILTRRVELATA